MKTQWRITSDHKNIAQELVELKKHNIIEDPNS